MNAENWIDTDIVKQLKEKEEYKKEQYGKKVKTIDMLDEISVDTTVVYLLGCNDIRGNYTNVEKQELPHAQRIREAFYKYYNWHPSIEVVDLGDVKTGKSPEDTYAALQELFSLFSLEQQRAKTMTLFLGGSSDQITGAYNALKKQHIKTDILAINSILPILPNDPLRSKSFLLNMLIEDNSYLKHYSHLAYQSYLNSVDLLTNLDKFSFENIRLGQLREDIDSLEPIFRATDLISLDLMALAPTAYPLFHESPNGLTGGEACRLMQFAGMATRSNFIHISGYDTRKDIYNHYAMSVAQMMWYAIEGFSRYQTDIEPNENNKDQFDIYEMSFADYNTSFFKSKISNRWWMLGPNQEYIACNIADYEQATNHKISEKWLRSINRN